MRPGRRLTRRRPTGWNWKRCARPSKADRGLILRCPGGRGRIFPAPVFPCNPCSGGGGQTRLASSHPEVDLSRIFWRPRLPYKDREVALFVPPNSCGAELTFAPLVQLADRRIPEGDDHASSTVPCTPRPDYRQMGTSVLRVLPTQTNVTSVTSSSHTSGNTPAVPRDGPMEVFHAACPFRKVPQRQARCGGY